MQWRNLNWLFEGTKLVKQKLVILSYKSAVSLEFASYSHSMTVWSHFSKVDYSSEVLYMPVGELNILIQLYV